MKHTAGQADNNSCEGDGSDRFVTLGRISGLHGVRGWVKVYSETRPRENILQYASWYIRGTAGWEERTLEQGRSHGKTLVAKLSGCDDREAAAGLMDAIIAVRRSQLPATGETGEYYWTDLEGLAVVNREGVSLGRVSHLFETGSNDVLVVNGEREHLSPDVPEQVGLEGNLAEGLIVVDWDPEF